MSWLSSGIINICRSIDEMKPGFQFSTAGAIERVVDLSRQFSARRLPGRWTIGYCFGVVIVAGTSLGPWVNGRRPEELFQGKANF